MASNPGRTTRTGKIKVTGKARTRTTPGRTPTTSTAKTDPRQDMLNPYKLSAVDYESLTNIEFSDFLHSLEIYGVDRTVAAFETHPADTVPFPFGELLEAKRNENEYLLNFNPSSSISLGDCKKDFCRATKSVSFYSNTFYRGDEPAVVRHRCNVCLQFQ